MPSRREDFLWSRATNYQLIKSIQKFAVLLPLSVNRLLTTSKSPAYAQLRFSLFRHEYGQVHKIGVLRATAI